MRRAYRRRLFAGLVAVLAVLSTLTGCTTTVEGTASKSGSGDVPRNNDSERQYPNLQKECDVLTEDILAETVGRTRWTSRAPSWVRCVAGRPPTRGD